MSEGARYDVALSFAGEDRDFVSETANALEHAGVTVFYDVRERSSLLGAHLDEPLQEALTRTSRFVAVFVSRHYPGKRWTELEWGAIQRRAAEAPEAFLLPIRLDDTQLIGLSDSVGYVDGRTSTPQEIASIIASKVFAPPKEMREALARWTERGHSLDWLLPASETESAGRLQPEHAGGEWMAAFIIASAIRHGQVTMLPRWLQAWDDSGAVADTLGAIASSQMRRVRWRAAGLVCLLSGETRSRAVERLRMMGDPHRLARAIECSTLWNWLENDQTLPPTIRGDIAVDLRAIGVPL